MFVVECPEVTTGRGQRLVSESRIRGMAAVPEGWALRVACPCGQEHLLVVGRAGRPVPQQRPAAEREEEVRRAQVVG